jgi:tRNA pseudouridine38-40 synthase
MPAIRYKLAIAYCGTRYHGWQRQPMLPSWKDQPPAPGAGIPTIQETVATALAHVVGHPVQLVGSSRTDAGVHAKGQIAHFDTDQTQIPPWGLLQAANHRLPPDILIRRLDPAPEGFDAIFSTECKRYQYAIWATDFRNPFAHDLLWHRWQKLNHDAMSAAAAHFNGTHDFASFCRPGHGRQSTIRAILDCSVSRRGPMLVVGVTGTGFLWNMVRIMVGTLVEVGLGKYAPDDIPKMLAARDRTAAGSTAPPHGLYLHWVRFSAAKNIHPLPSPGISVEGKGEGLTSTSGA